ncbi:MAG: hypothetical protein EX272_02085 [Chromatiales bacterium]|nr:MAG: hypothetical protein EX272_02085 [Chromatiales bacterium]
MKIQSLWIVAITVCLAACSKQEPAEPQAPEPDPAAAAEAAAPAAEADAMFDAAFVSHMHEHAEKLDDLMFALADGDLVGAATPAYWLSQHEAVDGVPEEWQNYLTGMRNAAYEVETADDLDTARAAAEEISVQCQGCHTAAGVIVSE